MKKVKIFDDLNILVKLRADVYTCDRAFFGILCQLKHPLYQFLKVLSLKRRLIVVRQFDEWIVVNTKWPVNAHVTARRAVCSSRISPIIITSGSWRKICFKELLYVIPSFSFI